MCEIASQEFLFDSLENELVHHYSYGTTGAVHESLFEYIENFYDRPRKHAALDYKRPSLCDETARLRTQSCPLVWRKISQLRGGT